MGYECILKMYQNKTFYCKRFFWISDVKNNGFRIFNTLYLTIVSLNNRQKKIIFRKITKIKKNSETQKLIDNLNIFKQL